MGSVVAGLSGWGANAFLNSLQSEARKCDTVNMDEDQPNSKSAFSAAGARGAPQAAPTKADVSRTLAGLPIDLAKIVDPMVQQAMTVLLNLVERQARENAARREENQRLKDENNRLKGEQGKPNIKPNKTQGDISSEKERRSRSTPWLRSTSTGCW